MKTEIKNEVKTDKPEKKVKEIGRSLFPIDSSMWQIFKVRWEFADKLCSSVPTRKALIEAWVNSRRPPARPPNGKSLLEVAEEVIATLPAQDMIAEGEELVEQTTLDFQAVSEKALESQSSDPAIIHDPDSPKHLVMRAATVRAHLKDCARILSSLVVGTLEGEKSFATKVVNSIYLNQRWIPLMRDGKPCDVADGFMDKAIHVHTAQGTRNALKRIGFLVRPTMEFELCVLYSPIHKKSVISMNDLSHLMQYGSVHGYAGERSDGEGSYVFNIEEGGFTDGHK
jgi:hypothetical protein